MPIASSRYRYDVKYSTMLSEFLQVHRTPASGKSTLAKLLSRHIRNQEPDVHVIWICRWKLGDVAKCGGWYSFLKMRKGWIPGKNTVFIFDEAQVSYKDGELWNELFKGIHDYPNCHAIAFASYGSPSSFIDIEGTSILVLPTARISLLPTTHGDHLPAAGLLFTRAEFNKLVSRQYPYSEYYFHPSFLDTVFGITEGHVGAMYSFLNIILGSDIFTFLLTRSWNWFHLPAISWTQILWTKLHLGAIQEKSQSGLVLATIRKCSHQRIQEGTASRWRSQGASCCLCLFLCSSYRFCARYRLHYWRQ